jgi:hypothetical protein
MFDKTVQTTEILGVDPNGYLDCEETLVNERQFDGYFCKDCGFSLPGEVDTDGKLLRYLNWKSEDPIGPGKETHDANNSDSD